MAVPYPQVNRRVQGANPANSRGRARECAPWYLTKATPSFADMLAKLRRTIIAAQYG
jgi:hypothetical protein